MFVELGDTFRFQKLMGSQLTPLNVTTKLPKLEKNSPKSNWKKIDGTNGPPYDPN